MAKKQELACRLREPGALCLFDTVRSLAYTVTNANSIV